MFTDSLQQIHRRYFFEHCGIGLGRIALASLLSQSLIPRSHAAAQMRSLLPHFAPCAKRVIYLFQAGGPSQLDLFDYKPKLAQLEGQPIPASVIQGQRYAFIQPDAAVLGPRFRFSRHGQAGLELADVMPQLAQVADDISVVRSVHTDLFNHGPAQLLANTGSGIPGRPSMGAWLSYGLGNDADGLPAFVVLKSGGSLSGGAAMWGAGFLPSQHQGVPFREQGDPILHTSNPPGYDRRAQSETLDLVTQLNQHHLATVHDPEITTRIAAYETAFRMQSQAPELMDFSQESQTTLDLYGAKPGDGKAAYANNCLLARRLAERGVRFIQVYHAGWDHHSDVEGGVREQCRQTDRASAALVRDLKQRGLWEDTLIVWGGEFGRTPMVEASVALGRTKGRDHHPQAFTMWFSGGGIRPGVILGRTDDLGFHVVERPIHVNDVQATILHCLGIDHRRLTFSFRGLDFRLTGVEDRNPIRELLL